MENIEADLYPKKGEPKVLIVTLEEGEEIVENLKKALNGNGLSEGIIVDCEGVIKEGRMDYFHKTELRSMVLRNSEVKTAAGKFVKMGDSYCGEMHVLVDAAEGRINGTLRKGKAAGDFKITVQFTEF